MLNELKNASSLEVVDDVAGVVFFGDDNEESDDVGLGLVFLGDEGFFFVLADFFFLGEGDGDIGIVLDVLEESRSVLVVFLEEDFFFLGVFGVVGGEA